MKRYLMKFGASIELLALLAALTVSPFLNVGTAQAVGSTNIRQEVNITDGYYYAPSGSYATSSETAAITDNNYSSPAYYFEVVASTTAATNATVALVDAGTGATITTVTVNGGNTYARYRSAQFLPSASTSVQYATRLNNESIGKGIIASRIVVLQNPASLTSTETQIELGNNETYTSTATSSLASPKYWYYNSAGWDGAVTFTASVTYSNTIEPAGVLSISTTTYTASQSVTLNANNTSTKVMLWGGGGAGGPAAANPSGGDGGAGGQFAQSTIAGLAGLTKTLTIGGTTAGGTAGASSAGADTTWDSTVVVAKGGAGGNQATASTTGSTTGCVGSDFCVAGGNGGKGTTTYGAGGGGGPGVNAAGHSATGAGIAGTASTDGNGGAGGAKNTTSKSNGNTGNIYGGGGGGAFRAGAGGTVSGGTGQQGKAIIVENITTPTVATTTIALQEDDGHYNWSTTYPAYIVISGIASSPTRVTSPSFTPTNGHHYRLAVSGGYNGATFAIYNAKIVIDQAGTGGATSPQVVTATGSGSWLIPAGVTTVKVELWGGGGGGNNDGEAGGAGAYVVQTGLSVTPGDSITYVIASGGGPGVSGGAGGAGFKSGGSGSIGSSDTGGGGGGSSSAVINGTTYIASGGGGAGASANANAGKGATGSSGGAGGNSSSSGVHGAGGGGGSGTIGSNGTATTGGAGGTGGTTQTGINGDGVAGGGGSSAGASGNGNNGTGGAGGTGSGGATTGTAGTGSDSGGGGFSLSPGGQPGAGASSNSTAGAGKLIITFISVPPTPFTLLEPQYLLANTKYANNTSLQHFITDFDPAEWNTTNNYLHAVSTANSSSDVVGVYDTSGVLQTNSTITNPSNFATSTLGICMPAVQTNLDTKATTNNNDIYADEIIVQVGVASTATGCGGAGPTTNGPTQVYIIDAQARLEDGSVQIIQ